MGEDGFPVPAASSSPVPMLLPTLPLQVLSFYCRLEQWILGPPGSGGADPTGAVACLVALVVVYQFFAVLARMIVYGECPGLPMT